MKGGIHNQNPTIKMVFFFFLKLTIKMVLGLDCFGFMARKAPESSKQQEAGDAQKKEGTEEAAPPEASENKGEKAVEKNKKGRGTGPPLVVPHFPRRSTLALI